MNRFTPIGEMRKLVTIQSIATVRTDDGETTDTASTFCQAWAKVAPLVGRESYLARAQTDATSYKINLLYRSGITQRMQATFDGRTFMFTSVVNVGEMNREIEILATEVLA